MEHMEIKTTQEQEPIMAGPAVPSDAEGISRVVHDTWLATYPNEEAGITKEDIEEQMKNRQSPEEVEKTRARILANDPNKRIFVAKEKDSVVGFSTLNKEDQFNQLKAIYILPEFQGRGVGKKLWSEILKATDGDGKKIIVHVATYNKNAIEFYKRLGFKETGKEFSDERFRMKSGNVIPETELVFDRENALERAKIELVTPDARYKESYLEALKEYNDVDHDTIDIEDRDRNFDAFLDEIEKNKQGLIVENVPQTKYWAVAGDRYIGQINYRPNMNDKLRFKGGNIGYSIRPSERGKGYASEMLANVLDKARADGMAEVMLTCDDDNIASKKVIEKAGGVRQSGDEENGVKFSRYIIKL